MMVRSTEIYKNNNLDQWVRSVPSAEVVKAIRSLVNSVLGHFGPLKKDRSDQRLMLTEDRSDQGPKWTPTTCVMAIPCNLILLSTNGKQCDFFRTYIVFITREMITAEPIRD